MNITKMKELNLTDSMHDNLNPIMRFEVTNNTIIFSLMQASSLFKISIVGCEI